MNTELKGKMESPRKRAASEDSDGIRDTIKRPNIQQEVIDISSQAVPEYDLTNEDDDDIPYTHKKSRSASPLILDSDDDKNDSLVEVKTSTRNIPSKIVINDEDDEDDIQEYFVITDEEDNAVNEEESESKSTVDQLKDSIQQNKNLNTAQCAICFDSPKATCVLPCGHLYCSECVFKALSSSKSSSRHAGPCSLCRNRTSYKSVTLAIFKKKKKSLIDN